MADTANTQLAADRLLAAIVETSDDAIVSKSLDGIILSWNGAAESIFGYSAEEAIGRHISLIIPQARLPEEDLIMQRLRAGQRVNHFETERIHRDGRLIPVSLTISPIKDDSGRVVGASKIARDITERRAVEQGLKEADEMKDRFIATLSHELRNPLAPVRAAAQLIRKAAQQPELRHSGEIIDRQLRHIVRLLEDLLDISRISTNKLEVIKSPILLSGVIRAATEASQPVIEAQEHKLTIALPDQVVHIDGDPIRLAQVFTNLLNNAAKYMLRGGHIVLHARVLGDAVEVSVKDQGVGIASAELTNLFQMYWQASADAERRRGGLGIGLALSRAIVELHGGSIRASSEGERKGSEFIVTLPVLKYEPQRPSVQPPAAPARQEMPGRRVLIVDDLRDSADSLAELLRALGHETYVSYDGAEAIDLITRLRPEVMLLDIGMPGMSGNDVCREVRQSPGGNAIYIVAITGWGQASDRMETSLSGFDLHLVKPVDGYDLARLIGDLPHQDAGRQSAAD